MKFIDIAKKRFSCRTYLDKNVEMFKLKQIMEAARIAPSANNKQPWYFYVIQNNKKLLSQIHESYHREWFNQAPVVIVCCADTKNAWTRKSDKKNHSDIDISIAIDHITLAATELNLATCWICNFDVNKVKEIFNLSESYEPVALISLGYCNKTSDTERFDKARKSIDEIVKFD